MIRKAYNRLVTSDGRIVVGAVVVFDEAGAVLSWHKLNGEKPFVEWQGGTYDLRLRL